MTSLFNQLLIKLQTRILAQVPDDGNDTGIRYIDQDFAQLEVYDTRPSVAFPCALIDYNQTVYKDLQLKSQLCTLNMNVRLGFDPYSSSNSLTDEATREKALSFYEIENKIYLAIQDWNADGLLTIPFKRISAITEKRQDKFRVRVIAFRASYEDRGMQAL